jgi:hypothetical protein
MKEKTVSVDLLPALAVIMVEIVESSDPRNSDGESSSWRRSRLE